MSKMLETKSKLLMWGNQMNYTIQYSDNLPDLVGTEGFKIYKITKDTVNILDWTTNANTY